MEWELCEMLKVNDANPGDQDSGPYQSVASSIRDASSITLACIASLGSVKHRAHNTVPKALYHLQTFIP